MENLEQIQEIARLILSISRSDFRTFWMRYPKICAKIAQIILNYNLDPMEINSYCIVNKIRTSATMFYNLPRGCAPSGNNPKPWDDLILEMYNLNVEPDKSFRRYRSRKSKNLSTTHLSQNKIQNEMNNFQNETNSQVQSKIVNVQFGIGTPIYNLIYSKIVKHLSSN